MLTRRRYQGFDSGYKIGFSADFDGSTGYLGRTPASNGDAKKSTIQGWLKISSALQIVYASYSDSQNRFQFGFDGAGAFYVLDRKAGVNGIYLLTANLGLSWSSHHNFCLVIDTAQATQANRVKLYIDGDSKTLTGTWPAQNYDTVAMNTYAKKIGQDGSGAYFVDGLVSQFTIYSGQALDASYFGSTVGSLWKPKLPPTNGTTAQDCWLNFAASGDLGNDVSANGNDWTKSGTITQSTDTP